MNTTAWVYFTIVSALKTSFGRFRRSNRRYVIFVLGPDGSPTFALARRYGDLSPIYESAREEGLRYWVELVKL
jgi:hypothetical protein